MHERPITRQPHFTQLAGEVVELSPHSSLSSRIGRVLLQAIVVFGAAAIFIIAVLAWEPQ